MKGSIRTSLFLFGLLLVVACGGGGGGGGGGQEDAKTDIVPGDLADADNVDQGQPSCTSSDDCIAKLGNPPQCKVYFCNTDVQGGRCELKNAEDNTPCDDGDTCTLNDRCKDGVCSYDGMCECRSDDDCKDKWHDLGQCETYHCDKSLNGGTCKKVPKTDGTLCDDGEPCTQGDKCLGGVCTPGEESICECTKDDDCPPVSPCDGKMICDKSKPPPYKCVLDSSFAVKCDSSADTFCLKNLCDRETGECKMTPQNEGEICEDNDYCTVESRCEQGVCQAKTLLDCDDKNPCTDDSCDNTKGCVHVYNNAPCSDNNACTEGDYCSMGQCVPGAPKNCDNGKFCDGKERCDPVVGCLGGIPPDCDDHIPCTMDSCDPIADACVHQWMPGAVEGPYGSPLCSDGTDNDCDGKTDSDDYECHFRLISVEPNEGPAEGGTVVTLHGEALDLVKQVEVDNVLVPDFTIVSPEEISITMPPHAPGFATVSISTGTIQFNLENAFKYVWVVQESDLIATYMGPLSYELMEGEAVPGFRCKLELKPDASGGIDPNSVIAQAGFGSRNTLPYGAQSWHWVDLTLDFADTREVEFASDVTVQEGGYLDMACRFSVDGGFTFLYGDSDGSDNGYSTDKAGKLKAWGKPKPGAIVINEIMWMGSNQNTKDEWIELRNMTKAPYDLTGYRLTSVGIQGSDIVFEDTNPKVVHNLVLEPNAYFLVAQFDVDQSEVAHTPDIVANNTMFLSNTPPWTTRLIAPDNTVVDQAHFSGQVGYNGDANLGRPDLSMERNAVPGDGLLDENWHTAFWHEGWKGDPFQTRNFGTPSLPNSDIRLCEMDQDCASSYPDVTFPECQVRGCRADIGRCGAKAQADGATCDDGLFCTVDDTCAGGQCKGSERVCADEDMCTVDSCDEQAKTCVHQPKDCDDHIECTNDYCDGQTGECVHEWDTTKKEGAKGDPTCSDGIDNDCDGLKDDADPQCQMAVERVEPKLYPTGIGMVLGLIGSSLDIVTKVLIGGLDAPFEIKGVDLIVALPSDTLDVGDYDVVVSDGIVSFTLANAVRFIAKDTIIWANTQWPNQTIVVAPGETTQTIYGRVWVPGITDSHGDPNLIIAEIGYGPKGSDPYAGVDWKWFTASYNALCQDCGNNYEYQAQLTIETAGEYIVAFRFSSDGYHYAYGDLDGWQNGYSSDTALNIVVQP